MAPRRVLLYARVSREEQAKDDSVSIDEQLSDMHSLCRKQGWQTVAEHVDCEDYRATQSPKKGVIVNPSGERTDRPQFLAALERIKAGEVDAILCWRDDRLVRHPRVAVVLEDALDIGDKQRRGKDPIQILDATGAHIDRFTLNIKAAVWREENKRRAERMRMGKIGTLKDGRWPGQYERFGYTTAKVPGKRGSIITLGDQDEVRMIQNIFDWYDSGIMVRRIRKMLIAQSARQKHQDQMRHAWTPNIISRILRSKDYTGQATWRFEDSLEYTIEIPVIVPLEQWERVQKKIDANKDMSPRRTKGIYMCQGLIHCGECERRLSIAVDHYHHRRMVDGTLKRYDAKNPKHQYRCSAGQIYPESHPRPYTWEGTGFDWAVWRKVVDGGIKTPELIEEQVLARQAELKRQGQNKEGEIANARKKMAEVEEQRAMYHRQMGRRKMTEDEFDKLIAETDDEMEYWKSEIRRLTELRDDNAKVQDGLAYTRELMLALQVELPSIDQSPEELRVLPKAQQDHILSRRQTIIRALCDKIIVWSNGKVRIEGLLDGSEGAQFGLPGTCWR
jgi:DNA invertase Pin-like site-specific DNA recombinase